MTSTRRPSPTGRSVVEGSQNPEPTAGNHAISIRETTPARLLRFPTVRERTGLSRSTIWRLERRGDFPRHLRISANAVAWLEEEIAEWIRSKSVREA
jgi:prophage regulatory protein